MPAVPIPRVLFSRRVVLWIGFGGLLALMVAIAFNAGRALRRIETTNTAVRQEFLRRDALLDSLRLQLYLSSVDVRDYLLDPESPGAGERRRDLEQSRLRIYDAAARLRAGAPPGEAAALAELQRDMDDYWKALSPIFDWDEPTRRARGGGFLRAEVFPRHQQLLQLAERMAAIDERQLQGGEDSVAAIFRDFRGQLTATALLTIGIGFVLAALSVRRILALERTSEQRYEEVVQARGELQKLSARLVAAQEEERRRLSRELHDEVAQSMAAVAYELSNLDAHLPDDASLKEPVARARRLTEGSVGVVRNMALLLRPSMLDDLGLVPALNWQAREVSRRTGLKVKVAADELPEDLRDDTRTCIYRVVQESLQNASRHAHATNARVTVRREPGHISVSVQDDGKGFDVSRDKGMGLLGMEERVRTLGGVFRVDSEPGTGTIVSALLPSPESNGTGKDS